MNSLGWSAVALGTGFGGMTLLVYLQFLKTDCVCRCPGLFCFIIDFGSAPCEVGLVASTSSSRVCLTGQGNGALSIGFA